MHTDEIVNLAPALEPLSAAAAAAVDGGGFFSDAIDGAAYLIETYIVAPLREMVSGMVQPAK